MRIAAFPAGEFQTNCYVVSSDTDSECVIIDPGQNAFPKIKKIVEENDLLPTAVFLTHGHADHTWNVPEVTNEWDIPVFAAQADHFMVVDPLAGVGPLLASMFPQHSWNPPSDLRDYPATDFEYANLAVKVLPLPGHTPGGVGLLIQDKAAAPDNIEQQPKVLFSGDTLFKGAVGRTDLPGGDSKQLLASIEKELIPLADDVVVAPGHGETSTMAQERANNIYLARFRN
ncbi:MAG: MBL fold metallo-hydrolase [Lawsonella sp.]